MIDFVCDGCHTQLQIGDDSAGKLGHCPHCGTNTRVPAYPRRTPKRNDDFPNGNHSFPGSAFWGLMFCIADQVWVFALFLEVRPQFLAVSGFAGHSRTSARSCRTHGITDSGKRVAAILSSTPWTGRSITIPRPLATRNFIERRQDRSAKKCSAFILPRLLIQQEGSTTRTSFEVPIWELDCS